MAFSLKKRKSEQRAELPVLRADPAVGLTAEQAEERRQAGYANTPVQAPGKSVAQIIFSNVFTYFNLIFFFLAACVIAVRSWNNAMFMGVVLVNMVIGIVQELKSKRTLDKLNLLTAPRGVAVRGGKEQLVATADLVRDDVVILKSGDQVYADAEVAAGECLVNESLITGEADEIKKRPGDALLSGSFLVSGSCRARLTAVGADSYASRLTLEARRRGKPKQSEMMRSLSNLVKWIGILIIPLGAIMAIKEIYWLGRPFAEGVVSTVAALIGMIPEGLYLLTTLALVASILRLAQKKTLVHEMSCIETLARVDTLCVDKTGTITENKMIVDSVVPLIEDRYNLDDIRLIMADYVAAMRDDNDTMAALRVFFAGEPKQEAIAAMPFTSSKKFGGVSFHADETYLLGAPDVLLGERYGEYAERIDAYAAKGCRVLLLADYSGTLRDKTPTAALLPLALILLNNKIRAEAPDTFRFFAEQGVDIKVISGDNHVTVSEVARRAGIRGAEKCVDARTLQTEEQLAAAAEQYTVFGRVTPAQKKSLVLALKARGHTVAMTGDGVNDVLALKEADCSIAVASGSDVACQVSHIVLMDNNFASMPSVVAEGRRVINNIERSASLYLVKNIFTFFLAFFTLFATLPYPFSPARLTLVNAVTIGIPSFILAMEPNESLITGKFLRNVIFRALPSAMTDLVLIVGIQLFYIAFHIDYDLMCTICTGVMGIVGLMMVHRTCKPYNSIRKVMIAVLVAGFAIAYFALPGLFTLVPLGLSGTLILAVFGLLAWPMLNVFSRLNDKLKDWWLQREEARKKAA